MKEEQKERRDEREKAREERGHPPVHVLEAALLGTGYTTEQHNDRVGLGWDEPQQEGVSAATVVTLEHRLTKRTVSMETDFFALGADQVVDDVTEGGRDGRKGGKEGGREGGREGREGWKERREGGREGREGWKGWKERRDGRDGRKGGMEGKEGRKSL